jgi:transposase
MMRSKDEARLEDCDGGDTKLAAFAAGVEADKNAVAAAIATSWSSGQVEGKINHRI